MIYKSLGKTVGQKLLYPAVFTKVNGEEKDMRLNSNASPGKSTKGRQMERDIERIMEMK